MRRGLRLKYVKAMRPRPGGRAYLYYARPGHKLVRLPDLPENDPDFLKAYAEAARGAPKVRSTREPREGTIGALCASYRRSDAFLDLRRSTREMRARIIQKISARWGEALTRDLMPRHVRADLEGLTGHAANNRLKVWRALTRHALDRGHIEIDPARDVRKRTVSTDGHHCWTDAEIAQFRGHHPVGTKARRAMELLLWTGARRSDAVLFGRQHMAGGSLTYTSIKTAVTVCIPLLREFAAELDRMPRSQMLFLETRHGEPHSVKGFGAWFARQVRAAGLPPRCTAHGLRKARARIMAENGKTAHQIAAWGGWLSLAEVQHYTAAVDRKRLTHDGANEERISDTDAEPVSNSAEKSSKIRGVK